jgi:hypothetical protein
MADDLTAAPHATASHPTLASYLRAVHACVERTLRQTGLPPAQLDLLLASAPCGAPPAAKLLRHPLAPFYLVTRSLGASVGADAEPLGAGFLLFLYALGLIDDVQDEEIPAAFAPFGPAVALNSGVLLLWLSIDTLWACEEAAPAARLRATLRAHALRLASGQHRDLAGRNAVGATDEAVAIARDKSAICGLALEYAGIYARARIGDPSRELPPLGAVGDALAEMQQITDDVTDLFGARAGADLRTGTRSVPLAALFEATPEAERPALAARLPTASPDEVVRLVYASGAMQAVARVTDAARFRVHEAFAGVPGDRAYLTLFLAWLDDLAATFYKPLPIRVAVDLPSIAPPDRMAPGDAELLERLLASCRAAQQRAA